MLNSVAFQQRSWTQCSLAEIKGQADTIVQPSDGASAGCPFKNGYKSFVKCAESCLVPLLENLPLMSWEKAFLGSGNLCLKCVCVCGGGSDAQHFFHKSSCESIWCLQNPAAGFQILFSRVGNRTQGPTHAKITLCTELHPVSKQYAAQIWLEAVKTCHREQWTRL